MSFLGFVLWGVLTFVIAVAAFLYGAKVTRAKLIEERNVIIKQFNGVIDGVVDDIQGIGNKLEERRTSIRKEVREEIRQHVEAILAKLGV